MKTDYKDIPTTKEDTLYIVNHTDLKDAVTQAGFLYEYELVYKCSGHYAVVCTMKDPNKIEHCTTDVGEVTMASVPSGTSFKEQPITLAFIRAFDRCAITMLRFSEKHVYSNLEYIKKGKRGTSLQEKADYQKSLAHLQDVIDSEEEASIQESTVASIGDDDMIIRIGPCCGSRYGDVKNTGKFRDFLSWASATDLAYKDVEQQRQLQFLKGVINGKQVSEN